MPRKEGMVAPEGNGPTPQYVIPGGITLEDFRRALLQMRAEIKEFKEDLRSMDQRLAGLKQDARQPRLVMKADGSSDTTTCERTESATKQFKRRMGIAFLPTGSIPTRYVRPISA